MVSRTSAPFRTDCPSRLSVFFEKVSSRYSVICVNKCFAGDGLHRVTTTVNVENPVRCVGADAR